MKKLFAALLVAALCMSSVCLAAGAKYTINGVSLSDLSYEELVDLKSAVEKEIADKSGDLESFQVSSGKYTVGEDIPAGTYRCECKGAYSAAMLNVYESSKSAWPETSEVMAELYGSSVIGKLELSDGNIVEIEGGTVDFTEYQGI